MFCYVILPLEETTLLFKICLSLVIINNNNSIIHIAKVCILCDIDGAC